MASQNADSSKSWIRQASTWISLSATIFSLLALYLVHFDKGKLEIELPMSVGILLRGDTPGNLLIPVVFYNTGALRTTQLVRDITVTLSPIEDDGLTNQSLYYEWYENHKFMGKLEFERLYPDKKENVQDYFVYESRDVPFNIKGGESDYKLLHLKFKNADPKIKYNSKAFQLLLDNLSAFQLLLKVEPSGRSKGPEKVSYYRKGGLVKGYNWFDVKPPKKSAGLWDKIKFF